MYKAVCDLLSIGPNGVRALPLAAGINVGGHYFGYIIPLLLLFLPSLFKTTEGVVVGFQILAWAPKKNNKNLGKKKNSPRPPPWPPGGDF